MINGLTSAKLLGFNSYHGMPQSWFPTSISIQMELFHDGPLPSLSYCDMWVHVINCMGPTLGSGCTQGSSWACSKGRARQAGFGVKKKWERRIPTSEFFGKIFINKTSKQNKKFRHFVYRACEPSVCVSLCIHVFPPLVSYKRVFFVW